MFGILLNFFPIKEGKQYFSEDFFSFQKNQNVYNNRKRLEIRNKNNFFEEQTKSCNGVVTNGCQHIYLQ